MLPNLKKFVKDNEADIILVVGVILISLISFGGGWLVGSKITYLGNESIKIEEISPEKLKAEVEIGDNQTQIIGNKQSKIYHYPWCPGAKNIKEENKIYFNSKEEAEKAGYQPAENCPGL